MTAESISPSTVRGRRPARTRVLPLVAAAAIASVSDLLIATSATAAGADPGFHALSAAVFVPFGLIGLAAGLGGWLAVRRLAARPSRVLRVLVPAVILLSFVPDLLVAPRLPGADPTGVVALMLMHLVVAGVGVPVFARVAPLAAAGSAGGRSAGGPSA